MAHSNFGDDDDDDECEDEGREGNRLLRFMFGNVNDAGDLDVDYLDKDGKEHLSELVEKIGPSLTNMDLLVRPPHTPADAADQDYDEKAEDAVDYEDIDEQYEGPEIQTSGEEDHLLPKREYFSAHVSLAILEPKPSVFDDENYDEEEEEEKEQEALGAKIQSQTTFSSEQGDCVVSASGGEKFPEDDIRCGSADAESLAAGMEDFQEITDVPEEPMDCKGSTPLPVLCVEDGMEILRFSEVFGIQEPMKKMEKRDCGYFTHKEKYTYMDAADLVEDNEEAFLKGAGEDVLLIRQEPAVQQKLFESNDDHTMHIDSVLSTQPGEQIEDIYSSPEPMKEGISVIYPAGWLSPLHQKLFPIELLDWEEQIIWDNCPANCDDYLRSPENFVSDLEALVSKEIDQETGLQNPLAEQSMKPNEKDHVVSLHKSPVLLESFHSDDSLGSMALPFSKIKFHPQLLRLESRLEVNVSGHADGKGKNVAAKPCKSNVLMRFDNLTLQDRAMMEESLDNIIWEPHTVIAKPKLIINLNDEKMLFETLDNKESKHLHLNDGAMITTHSTKHSTVVPSNLSSQIYQSGWQFNIANDKFYMNHKVSQQLQPNSNKFVAHGIRVHHSAPAITLQTMKLKLSNKDIANFHRPKAVWYPYDIEVAVKEGKLPTQGPMKLILKSLGGKGSKLHVDAEETLCSVKVKASKKLDFKPTEPVKIFYLGKELEDDKSLAAQNVQPYSLLHLVRTKIHLLPRAQKLPGENKSLQPPWAFKKKSDLSVKDGHVFLMEYCEERPLLLSNAGMGANLCTYYRKTGPSDQSGGLLRTGNSTLGNVLALEPSDKSPFLGDMKAGCSQSSLETNMYKAPIFQHKVPATDFLLIRSAKGKLSIRHIYKIAVVGQQEPLMEVMSPGSKNLQNHIMNRMLVFVYHEFLEAEKRGLPPNISADELSACFPNLSKAIIRKKIKDCAFFQRDNNGKPTWSMRHDFQIPSEGVLRKLVSPEQVCAYESMQAGLYHLKHLGITQLTHPTSVSSAMSQLPNVAIVLAAASHIERELLITPWNLSSNFVVCTNQDRGNIERLEITGVGDPSGQGLGFSYVRTAPKAPTSSTIMKKKTAATRGSSTTITGMDADLRRLSMEAAREVLLKFNVPDDVIAKQTRWHRIAMIFKLSSEQAASGIKVDPTTISKYARGRRMSFLQLQQQTRDKCQEIWDHQVQSLSAVDAEENESDTEANGDLDSFAGDLENLLDAEECGDGEEGNNESKFDRADGVKGLKLRRRPSKDQAEEEIEDEAEEAAELCRLLMNDVEAEEKKKKNKTITGDMVFAFSSQSSAGAETVKQVKIANPRPKQVISVVQPSGSATKENTIRDLATVQSAIVGKVKEIKLNGTSSSGQLTKAKILGDNPKMFKEKKSSRERFVCGACGQLGHMRTNKHCPKYGEDPESLAEATEEKTVRKPCSLDPSSQSQLKTSKKKLVNKSATKIAVVEAPEGEKSNSDIKVVKFKCSNDKHSGKLSLGVTESSDHPVASEFETGDKSVSKVSRIKISNRMKPDEMQVETSKCSIIIRPLMDNDRGQAESSKLSVIIKPPANTERDQVELHKDSTVIHPLTDKDREKSHKKIIIKLPKEIIDLDTFGHDGSNHPEQRKTKKIVELSSFEMHGKQEILQLTEESVKQQAREGRRWWQEVEKKRMLEKEQEKFAEIERYEKFIQREREEKERQKAKKKKKVEIKEDYSEDYMAIKNERRMPERDRSAKRQYGADYGPPTKRRKGGEVGLANVLERIVETLRANIMVSYLFLKPVSKKEAPDYLDIIDHPMDLSTIRDKVRRMVYKDRNNFRRDVWQIAYNAHNYNDGRNPGIPPLADQLLKLCDCLLDEYHESLSDAEAGIESRNP